MGKLAIILSATTGVLILSLIVQQYLVFTSVILISFAAASPKDKKKKKDQTSDSQPKINLNSLTLPNSEDIYITLSPNLTIYGTLSSPSSSSSAPLIIVAPGSGPTDHNGNTLTMNVTSCSYYYLAQGLQQSEVAVFRYDKRVVGKSRPVDDQKFVDLVQETFFEQFIEDFEGIVDYLSQNYKFEQIYLLGHSQGSLVALSVASNTKIPITGVISVSGAGQNIATVIKSQLQPQLSPQPELLSKSNTIIDKLKNGETVPIDQVPSELVSLFGSLYIQKFWISWMKYEPEVIIKEVKVPVLILQGTKDLQISELDAQKLEEACKNGKAELCELQFVDKMNHVLKSIESQEQNIESYQNPNFPLNKNIVPIIKNFIINVQNINEY